MQVEILPWRFDRHRRQNGFKLVAVEAKSNGVTVVEVLKTVFWLDFVAEKLHLIHTAYGASPKQKKASPVKDWLLLNGFPAITPAGFPP